ncbi:hypothetical protein G3578_02930 [Brevibacillus sp. SYP-B805]|uniref:hypothetical protein n=1 Tax=Brevibacillus sp. SYP-B805 TaxID=1578199 RepID=UPI0013EDE218|nr:hypothetical protein [Brevibacillus sp. SYP-B805]NGQ94127.1 hypothetical protein [Brevibacillus sp. SYP-B805]
MMMLRKILILSLMVGSLGFMAIIPAMPIPNAHAQASPYLFTYKLPPNVSQLVTFTTIRDDFPDPVKKVHAYTLGTYFDDTNGGYTPEKIMATVDKWETLKIGFLFQLFDTIGGLPPVYPEGYRPDEMNKRIAETVAKRDGYDREIARLSEGRATLPPEEWEKRLKELQDKYAPYAQEAGNLHRQRGEIEMRARVQALIDAGFVLPEEVAGERIMEPATKTFVANVLYRALHEVRPYKGSVAPLDTQDIAVRWAIEVGLPGFDVDPRGNVYPDVRLQMTPGPNDVVGEYPYRLLFMYVQRLLPSKWVDGKWQYYQTGGANDVICAECFLYVNGQPYSQYVARRPTLLNNPSFKQQLEQTKARMIADTNARIQLELQKKRLDVMKPRIWNWSTDLIHNPRFAQVIASYRKTRGAKALNAVYQAVKNEYHLFPRQDSLVVIQNVLDHVK